MEWKTMSEEKEEVEEEEEDSGKEERSLEGSVSTGPSFAS